jgi:hypothetical protein
LGGTTTNPKRDLSNPLKEYGDIQVTEKKKKRTNRYLPFKILSSIKIIIIIIGLLTIV